MLGKLCVCGHEMKPQGKQTLEMNGSSLGSNLWTDHVPVEVYICSWCGRMAFFEPEDIRERRFQDACEKMTMDDLRAIMEGEQPPLLQKKAGERLEELEQQKQKLYREARKLADALTQTRVAAFDQLNKQITKELDFLNMPGVRFALSIRKGPLASAGQDAVEFLISANPGEEPKPLAKIASGGELSRIMLAIQTALAEKDDIPTIIYDEIDTGVSGLAASRIGRKLHQSSKGRQVLCITHTAQIAAMADHHLLIQKNVEGQRTYTEIHPLDETGRMKALARIISGDQVTELSLANAKEMLEKARGLDNPHA